METFAVNVSLFSGSRGQAAGRRRSSRGTTAVKPRDDGGQACAGLDPVPRDDGGQACAGLDPVPRDDGGQACAGLDPVPRDPEKNWQQQTSQRKIFYAILAL